MLKLVTALVIGTMIFLGANASTQPASSPEPPITYSSTFDDCDPDTTCEGLEAEVKSTNLDQATTTPAHEPWQMTSTCEHNTVGGFGGWVCTQNDIPADHECVVHISAQPYRAIVVPDTSIMCSQA